MADGEEKDLTKAQFEKWFEELPVDGWVERVNVAPGLDTYKVEMFAHRLKALGLKEGDYVRVQVVTKEDLERLRGNNAKF